VETREDVECEFMKSRFRWDWGDLIDERRKGGVELWETLWIHGIVSVVKWP